MMMVRVSPLARASLLVIDKNGSLWLKKASKNMSRFITSLNLSWRLRIGGLFFFTYGAMMGLVVRVDEILELVVELMIASGA